MICIISEVISDYLAHFADFSNIDLVDLFHTVTRVAIPDCLKNPASSWRLCYDLVVGCHIKGYWQLHQSLKVPAQSSAPLLDTIHLLSSLERDMKICPTKKIHVTPGRHVYVRWDQIVMSPDLPNNLLFIIPKAEARRYTAQNVEPGDTTGRHDVWRETRRFIFPPRDFSRAIIFLYSSYQLYEV